MLLRSIRYFVPVMAFGLVAALSQGLLAQETPAAPGTPNAQTATITGTVTGPDGKPAANAQVMLQQRAEEGAKKAQPQANNDANKGKHKRARARYKTVERATTDAEGKFTFKNVAAGSYRVVAGEKGVGMGHSKMLKVTAGQNQTVDIQLKEGRMHKDKK